MIRVLIAEDQRLFINALQKVIEEEKDFEIVGYCDSGDEVLNSVLKYEPDVLLLDINMPGMDGVTVAEQLRKSGVDVRILVVTSYSSKLLVNELHSLGVNGFILKSDDINVLFEAIRTVYNGESYFTEEIRDFLKKKTEVKNHPTLSSREIQIIQLICQGLSSNEIAERLHISPLTVDTHRKKINQKLNIKHTSELIKYAIQRGLA
ncbi:DNA-binding response regulator [Thermaurantimonas aggregans]|uniref:DNA-binding response regulator n=1 Tax=Thermaurantimonas aggregans TaxID=2173829 RepID=A0A401XKF4_9FLAO|nr:response regulator transcription factor [Thermaurantimonas aggregans]MCX8148359.1 response regulator transcription factor [Thermaurantimonas aggregans]GCD77451.1 DNA-binding response regulator [Thermaurantimonas aggregans]